MTEMGLDQDSGKPSEGEKTTKRYEATSSKESRDTRKLKEGDSKTDGAKQEPRIGTHEVVFTYKQNYS